MSREAYHKQIWGCSGDILWDILVGHMFWDGHPHILYFHRNFAVAIKVCLKMRYPQISQFVIISLRSLSKLLFHAGKFPDPHIMSTWL